VTLLTELYPAIAVSKFCTVFGKTRQAWYYSTQHRLEQDMTDNLVVNLVKEIRLEQPVTGTRKLYHLLQPRLKEHGIKMGRDALFDLLDKYGLLLRYRRRKAITTDSNHPYYKYPNLIKDLPPTGIKNKLWVSDITYIRIAEGFGYLSLVTDAYSRMIIGYCLWDSLAAQGTINALEMALKEQQPKKGELIHHSDRGVQYCCYSYVECLQSAGANISMSDKGDPYQNAIAERVNGILKSNWLGHCFTTMEQAREALVKAVPIYNEKRPHDSLAYLTPSQAHELTGIIKRNWKNYTKKVGNKQPDLQSTKQD
jgi:transposase InsO family protein